MLIGKSRRWWHAAVFPLVLAGCASQGAETGTAGPGLGAAAPGSHQGLSAVRHVWVIELENQGYQQSFGTPSASPAVPADQAGRGQHRPLQPLLPAAHH
jgi:hypothetical protein